MNKINNELIEIATRLVEITGNTADQALLAKRPRCSIYAGEDAVHISFDDYEETWAEVSWDNFYEGIRAATTENESMNTISRMKEVIRRYEEWHGFTHDEWLAEQTTPTPNPKTSPTRGSTPRTITTNAQKCNEPRTQHTRTIRRPLENAGGG